ncbi:DUF1957 domain-containing protein [Chitinispirillales bacterium ANBcel5]|uniref:glycoside hydrolase family 57 protein n=1 Tax=Cellulosispirillum alkaliphilum TaxID=3039283 RepID=UPI002A55B805|nr:DUF1957 domain-containing protein [Chitinispirillales bacterium ANBcel5]
MEENWFYEALTETYIPLLVMFRNLQNDTIQFRLTMSLTPTLCSMLNDSFLQQRYIRHIKKLISLAEKEVKRTRYNALQNENAKLYLDKFKMCYHLFENIWQRDLIREFRTLQDAGLLEIITCCATHGYLPNMQDNEPAVKAQIKVGVESYIKNFGCHPRGIWLPECGYYPGLEKFLFKEGLKFFFVDTHGLLLANPQPRYGVYAPLYCSEAPVAAFGRDAESSRSVWSAQQGYPGHPAYRDFYRDIGFELEMDYISPYIDPIGLRIHTGIKYHRVTDIHSEKKEYYNRQEALNTAAQHAGNFMFNRQLQIQHLTTLMDRPPLIVSPYDAELFGHWWYEGPEWLNYLIRRSQCEQNSYEFITPSDYLSLFEENQVSEPSFSSWGEGGYSYVWLNETNSWIYHHIHQIENIMTECASQNPQVKGVKRRILNQMARELLLSQSSDWAFIMKTGTMVHYAQKRTKEHIANFLTLYEYLKKKTVDENCLSFLEQKNNIFAEIDYNIYCRQNVAGG